MHIHSFHLLILNGCIDKDLDLRSGCASSEEGDTARGPYRGAFFARPRMIMRGPTMCFLRDGLPWGRRTRGCPGSANNSSRGIVVGTPFVQVYVVSEIHGDADPPSQALGPFLSIDPPAQSGHVSLHRTVN